jgi:hypothetical protein
MATKYWVGRAASVTQITKVVFSSIVSTNTYSVTINGKTVSAVAASTSLGDLIDALVGHWFPVMKSGRMIVCCGL